MSSDPATVLAELVATAEHAGLIPPGDPADSAPRAREALRRAIAQLTGGCGRMEWCDDCQRHVPHGWLHTRDHDTQTATDPAVLPPGTWLARGGDGFADAYALRWFTHPERDPDERAPWIVLDPWGFAYAGTSHLNVTGWTVLTGPPSFPNWRPDRG